MKIQLKWTEPAPPNKEIPYDHVIANTPFGRILITWKSWKKYQAATIDEFPAPDFFKAGSVEELKKEAEQEIARRLNEFVSSDEDKLEAAFWNFDARHKGYGEYKETPQSQRDAFKAELRSFIHIESSK